MPTNLELAQLHLRLCAATRGLPIDCADSGPTHAVSADDWPMVMIEYTQAGQARTYCVPVWDLISLARLARVPLKTIEGQPDAPSLSALGAELREMLGVDLVAPATVEPRRRVRRSDPETSRTAAQIRGGTLNEMHRKVVAALEGAGEYGLTDYELESECGSHGSTWRTRRAELTSAGRVVNSQEVRLVKGRKRVVWKLAQYHAVTESV